MFKKILFFLTFASNTSLTNVLNIESLDSSSKEIAGTPARLEMEYKLAFLLSEDTPIRDLTNAVEKSLKKVIRKSSLKFASFVGNEYYIEKAFQPFAFKDTYLDTKNLDVLKADSSYRLRYRWNRFEYYLRHLTFPFLKGFYPTRCEIQFKAGYKAVPEKSIIKVQETRFEFRNDSNPFNKKQNAPSTPWPYQEYIKYAKSGVYKDYVILPTYKLIERLKNLRKVESAEIIPVVEAVTQRNRIHINVSHPWGWGPNPDQVFIVTIDKSYFQSSLFPEKKNKIKLLEIEVEPERNTTTQLRNDLDQNLEIYKLNNDAAKIVNQTVKTAVELLNEDLSTIVKSIEDRIITTIDAERLELSFKYKRMNKFLGHIND